MDQWHQLTLLCAMTLSVIIRVGIDLTIDKVVEETKTGDLPTDFILAAGAIGLLFLFVVWKAM